MARNNFENKFSKKDFPSDLDEIEIRIEGKKFLDIIEQASGMAFSRSELKRLIKDGAVEINGQKFNSLEITPSFKSPWEIKLGKRNFYKVKIL
jgi:tyrosyl-tRNA synthetase